MTDKLEKLTQQIYQEGLEKARAEAQKIISSAEEEKIKVLRSARQEAEDIISVAKKEAEDLQKQVDSGLRLASQQTLALLRQKINELISVQVAEDETRGMFKDPEFLKRMVETVMKEWVGSGCRPGQEFFIHLPAETRDKLEKYFLEKSKSQLDKGLEVRFDENISGGFSITPTDGSYRVGFTEDDFKALIIYFLRPRLREFLFSEDRSNE